MPVCIQCVPKAAVECSSTKHLKNQNNNINASCENIIRQWGCVWEQREWAGGPRSAPHPSCWGWDVWKGHAKGTRDMPRGQGTGKGARQKGKARLNLELYLVARRWLDPISLPGLGGDAGTPTPLHQPPRMGIWEVVDGSEWGDIPRAVTAGVTWRPQAHA